MKGSSKELNNEGILFKLKNKITKEIGIFQYKHNNKSSYVNYNEWLLKKYEEFAIMNPKLANSSYLSEDDSYDNNQADLNRKSINKLNKT